MKAVNKARKEGDEKQLDKLMRRQGAVMKMNTRASLETLKTMPFTLIPFYLIYTVVRVAFNDLAVALLSIHPSVCVSIRRQSGNTNIILLVPHLLVHN